MKKHTLLISLLMIFGFVYSQGIEFEQGNWNEVLNKAALSQKPIFVDVYTSWCRPCKVMSSQVFPLEEVGNLYNSTFVCYKIDAEKGEGVQIAKDYEVDSYPTYLFLNPNGTLVMKARGSMSPKEFMELVISAKEELSVPKTIMDWETEYEPNKTDTAFLRMYMEKRTLLGKSNAELFDEYLALFPAEQRVSKEIIDIYSREIDNIKIHSLAYNNLQDNRAKFSKLGVNGIRFISQAVRNSMREAISNKDELLLEAVIEENEKIPKLFRTTQKEKIYMNYYKSVNDLEKYIAYATAYCENWLMKKDIMPVITEIYSDELNSIAWNFFEKVDDKTVLKKALRWSERSLEISPNNHYYLDTYANLLYKLGMKSKAIATEKKAIKLLKELNDVEKIAEYEQVLQKMKSGEKTW